MTKLLIYYFVGITGAIAVGLWYNTIVILCTSRLYFYKYRRMEGVHSRHFRLVFVKIYKAVDI